MCIQIRKTFTEGTFEGQIINIEKINDDLLYLIEYEDGDMEHLSLLEVCKLLI